MCVASDEVSDVVDALGEDERVKIRIPPKPVLLVLLAEPNRPPDVLLLLVLPNAGVVDVLPKPAKQAHSALILRRRGGSKERLRLTSRCIVIGTESTTTTASECV